MVSIQESVILAVLCLSASIYPSMSTPSGTKCDRVSNQPTCVCQTKDGIIDLTGLGSSDGVPRFEGLVDSNGFMYSYNPCYSFTVPGSSECVDVYSCQNIFGIYTYAIADKNTEQIWIDGTNQPYVYYTSSSQGEFREVFVKLVCDKDANDPVATTEGDSANYLHYEFTLTSVHACPKAAGGIAAGVAGIVLMVLLIAGIVGYFVIGAIIMKVHFKNEGLDIIPQKTFWFTLPVLIKEGSIFTYNSVCDLIRAILHKHSQSGYKQGL